MTQVRMFHPEVRLKRLLAEPGGIKASEALARADQGIEDIRHACLVAIDRKIEEIAVLCAAPDDRSLDRGYVLANEIFAEAGVFGLSELSDAALNLCQLLAARDPDHTVPIEALSVHVQSMRALRTPAAEGSQALRASILHGLRKLNSKFTS